MSKHPTQPYSLYIPDAAHSSSHNYTKLNHGTLNESPNRTSHVDTIVSGKSAHGQSTLQVCQSKGWVLFARLQYISLYQWVWACSRRLLRSNLLSINVCIKSHTFHLQAHHGNEHKRQFLPLLHEWAKKTLPSPWGFISGREGCLAAKLVFATQECWLLHMLVNEWVWLRSWVCLTWLKMHLGSVLELELRQKWNMAH